ncbi:glycosyltransferase family 2 protein [Hydrogenophaga sp. RWCD_12]|uniref:glycosyltransferase family 2 protein n=1 Tax=Hydrogenophaga sp. RWCD_12 TaxID=3391190 RepID=UPI003984B888
MSPVNAKVGVVIPSYRVTAHILDVVTRVGPRCHAIYVVDDACPDGSGRFVQEHCRDPRVKVVFNEVNLGVGGAVMHGYRVAVDDGCDVIVKIDGDGQMAPELLPQFIDPILEGYADYTKGNRFFDLSEISQMPAVRLFGNAVLSFMSKISSGYWDVFDPTNGYTAIHARIVEHLPLDKISRRYFFESDMLFRLNTLRCVVLDVPMDANYGDEESNLKIKSIVFDFLFKHIRNFFKRIFYNYFLRDLSPASLELLAGPLLLLMGTVYGATQWQSSAQQNVMTAPGTVMLAALPVLMGFQLILAFLSHDMQSVPKVAIHRRLHRKRKALSQTPV